MADNPMHKAFEAHTGYSADDSAPMVQQELEVWRAAWDAAMDEAGNAVRNCVGTLSMFATSRECIGHNGAVRECDAAIKALGGKGAA